MKKILILSICLLYAGSLLACPNIKRKLVDYNCDQKFKMAAVGDSIVKGYDPSSSITGGYVARLERKIRSRIKNLGINGARASSMVLSLNRNLSRPGVKRSLQDVDVVMISIGVNDFFDIPGEDQDDLNSVRQFVPSVVRNIKRIAEMIRDSYGSERKKPYILGGAIPRVNRTNQNVYVGELNQEILRSGDNNFHPLLRLDSNFSKSNLNSDNLHPTQIGYQEIADYLFEFFKRDLGKEMIKDRPDLDDDGIADIHEPSFGMDPNLQDTDMNGLADGEEIFG